MSDFPPAGFTQKEDSSGFSISSADPGVKIKGEGGYATSRKRYTRRPRRTITTKFTAITSDNKDLIEAFWNAKLGGSVAFTYTIPTNDEEIMVRFSKELKFSYKGMGGTHLWDIADVSLEEV